MKYINKEGRVRRLILKEKTTGNIFCDPKCIFNVRPEEDSSGCIRHQFKIQKDRGCVINNIEYYYIEDNLVDKLKKL